MFKKKILSWLLMGVKGLTELQEPVYMFFHLYFDTI